MSDIIENTTSVIDSRDIIERIEDLTGDLEQAYEEGQFMREFAEWVGNTTDNSAHVYAAFGDEKGREVVAQCEELRKLWSLAEQCAGYGDWEYGEALVHEDYFTDYIKELVNDCYEMPKDMNSGKWPFCHMVMDWEAAAEAAKVDYTEVDFAGQTYLMRT